MTRLERRSSTDPRKRSMSFSTLLLIVLSVKMVRAQLLVDFYATSCPRAETIITAAVQQASVSDPFTPAKLLRLFFHDCFVNGCDGSILIDPTATNNAEKTDPANQSLEGFSVIDAAKTTLETVCAGTVSCADIVALAARDAVLLTGGPSVRMPTGRRDGLVSLASNVQANIPNSPSNLDTLLAFFTAKGLNVNDLVILAGAHTIGKAHCSAFSDRLTFINGTVTIDPTLDPTYAATLLANCPQNPPALTTVPIDPVTESIFDGNYYKNLQAGRGLMTSDQVLFTDPRTKALVNTFAASQVVYFENWGPSFLAMGNLDVITAPSGEIRTNCRAFNSG